MPTDHDREPSQLSPDLPDQLLGISRQALAAGVYEMAYHALASALHAAESMRDHERLAAIQAEALRQQDIVDAQVPGHRLSRQTGRETGHSGWLEVLSVQVAAILSRQRAAHALADSTAHRRAAQ